MEHSPNMDINHHSYYFLDFIQANPKLGALISFSALGITKLFTFISFVEKGHINPIYIELFQIGGYVTTMTVGLFTILGYSKKFNDGKDKKN